MELIKLIEEIDPSLKKSDVHYKKLVKTIKFLEKKNKILFLTTSNRGGCGHGSKFLGCSP